MNYNWKKLINCVVEFNQNIEITEASPSVGMRGKVMSVSDSHDDVVIVRVDVSDYIKHNKQHAEANFYDSNGVACLTWFESRSYPSNGKVDIYCMNDDFETNKVPFDVVSSDERTFTVDLTKEEVQELMALTDPDSTLYKKLQKACLSA